MIESILLGIPIPPIFVSQKTNGKWDVIDGQQRLSTILQFLQVLKKENGEQYTPLVLQATKFLPSLEGVRWDAENLFSEEQKIIFKREKLNFTIIKETGDDDTSKYEMFQRLNTGGTHLSPQEIRNCLLIMINKGLYEVINEMNDNPNYKACTPMTDNQNEERYDMEWVTRYLVYTSLANDELDKIDRSRNMDAYLTEKIEEIALQNEAAIIANCKDRFLKIFTLLSNTYADNVFKRYKDGKFRGALLLSAYEAIIPGVYEYIDFWENNPDKFKEKVTQIYEQEEYEIATHRGIRPLDRMCQLIRFSRAWFANEDKKN